MKDSTRSGRYKLEVAIDRLREALQACPANTAPCSISRRRTWRAAISPILLTRRIDMWKPTPARFGADSFWRMRISCLLSWRRHDRNAIKL